MSKSRKSYNNAAYRYLMTILYGSIPNVTMEDNDDVTVIGVRTAKVATSLRTTSFRLVRALTYLENAGYITNVQAKHGYLTFEVYNQA